MAKVGDEVQFKKPKRNKPRGVVEHIETDHKLVEHWGAGNTPRYIKVAVSVVDRQTGEITTMKVWTTESKITVVRPRKP